MVYSQYILLWELSNTLFCIFLALYTKAHQRQKQHIFQMLFYSNFVAF